jgi:hypothetical protein
MDKVIVKFSLHQIIQSVEAGVPDGVINVFWRCCDYCYYSLQVVILLGIPYASLLTYSKIFGQKWNKHSPLQNLQESWKQAERFHHSTFKR